MKYKKQLPGFIILHHRVLDQYYIGASACIENYAAMMRSYIRRKPERFFGVEADLSHVHFMVYRTPTHKIACQIRNLLLAHPKLDQLGVFVNQYRRIKSRTRRYKTGKQIPSTSYQYVRPNA